MPLPARLTQLARSPRALAVATAAAALAALLGDAWSGGTVFAYRDMHRVYLPARRFFAERVLRGEWPDWYPFDGLGGSFVGQVVTGAFHPTSLLHLVLPRVLAFNWSVGLAHAAAIVGMALLLSRWGAGRAASLAAGLGFGLSGYLVSMDGNLPYLLSAAAIPWALWGLEGSGQQRPGLGWAIAAMALASMALGGDPQTAFLAAVLCGAAALAPAVGVSRRRSLASLSVIGALALLLAAVQLLPALSGFSEIGMYARDFKEGQRWSLEPLRLLDLVVPQPFAAPAAPAPVALFGLSEFQSLWADSLFVGAPVLALAWAGLRRSPRRREAWLLFALAAVGLVIALGSHTPVYELMQRALPPWRGFRYPEKTMAFVSFALAALAGLGAQAALESQRARRSLGLALVACLVVTFVAVGLGNGDGSALLKLAGGGEGARGELAAILPAYSAQAFIGVLLAVAALSLWLLLGRPSPAVKAVALVAMVGGSCLFANRGLSRGYRVEPALVFAEPKAVAQMRRMEPDPLGKARFYVHDEHQVYPEPVKGRDGKARAMVRFDSANLVRGKAAEFGVEGLVGYLPLTAGGRAWRSNEVLPDEVYLRSFNARFFLELDPAAKTIEDSFRVREVPGAGARIRLAQAIAAAGEADVAAKVRAAGFDPVAQVVVEAEGFPTGAPTEASVEVRHYAEERIEVEAQSQTACALFVADRFAPGWRATIDGQAAAIVPADYVGRAVALPAGRHQVEMTYRAPGLRTGAALSILGLIAAVALAVGRPRKRAAPRPPG